jgi:hypothetical protein
MVTYHEFLARRWARTPPTGLSVFADRERRDYMNMDEAFAKVRRWKAEKKLEEES